MMRHKVCTVTMSGPMDMASGIDYSGTYMKLEATLGEVYLRTDNATRLHYIKGEPASEISPQKRPNCDDWYLEKNRAPLVNLEIFNCSDAPADLVNFYFKTYKYLKEGTFPCQKGYDDGLCESDTVFKSLCPHTCTPLVKTVIAGITYFYQEVEIFTQENATYKPTVLGVCNKDNNWGAFTWAKVHIGFPEPTPVIDENTSSVEVLQACENISKGDLALDGPGGIQQRNWTLNPCSTESWSPLLVWLCPETCPLYTLLPPPGPATPPDEVDPPGAITPSRRLYAETVSSAGKLKSMQVVPYLPGLADGDWAPVLRTYVNGSDDKFSGYAGAVRNDDGTVTPATTCSVGNININTDPMYVLLDRLAGGMFPQEVEVSPTAKLDYHCRQAAKCPAFSGCVLQPSLMANELEVLYDGTDKTGLGGPATWLNFDRYAPKLLISAQRATNLLAGLADKWELTKTMFRSAPGAMRLTINRLDLAFAGNYLVTLVSPTSAGGFDAEAELGRSYGTGPGAGFGPWLSDVIRFQKFDPMGMPMAGTAEVSVFIGALPRPELLRLFIVRPGMAPEMLPAPRNPTMATNYGYGSGDGYFTFDLPEMNADYIAALDIDECEASPCGQYATCENGPLLGKVSDPIVGGFKCTCEDGYEGDPYAGCLLSATAYTEAATGSIYVRIIPEKPLEHGWRLREIMLYEDEQCTTALPFSTVAAPLPEPMNSERDTTWTMLTSMSSIYTGPPGVVDIGYSHYPHPTDMTANNKPFKYSNINLVDEQQQKDISKLNTEWWSECLQSRRKK
jgi:hypothetical protein